MDPWLSGQGAFDASWFQFPRNHHLAPAVREKLAADGRAKFVYVSHEHKDHFDPEFLASLEGLDFTYVVPRFRRSALRDLLPAVPASRLIALGDREPLSIPGGMLRLFLDDTELNRDSAILVRLDGATFLNMNDCKVHDQLTRIVREEGTIDVLAAQFSGATWHPTCYDYPEERYAEISRKKRISKFEAVARAIQTVKPRVYLPSAGPPCFLDPELFAINLQPEGTFPHAWTFIEWLDQRLAKSPVKEATRWPLINPGDVLDMATGDFVSQAAEKVDASNFEQELRAYAASYTRFFEERRNQSEGTPLEILGRLQTALQGKLDHLTLRARINVPLYVRLSDLDTPLLKVDFASGQVEQVAAMPESNFYGLRAPSWEFARVLDGRLTWEDFALTFRMRLNREPDAYQTLLQGFLICEAEDLNAFCTHMLNVENRCERIVVEAGGTRFSADRWCPHSGADLRAGWVEGERFLICPRHRWSYDLENGGKCLTAEDTIHAIALEHD